MPNRFLEKGKRGEREIVNIFKEAGYNAVRVPLSGSTTFQKGDVVIEIGGKKIVGEVKRRKKGLGTLYRWLQNKDLVFVRRDDEYWVVVIPLSELISICKAIEYNKKGGGDLYGSV